MGQNDLTNINNVVYQKLIDNITTLWGEAKSKAITAVNTELLDANWQTGKYIVEYELKGKDRAEYGKQLLVNLAKDLTARRKASVVLILSICVSFILLFQFVRQCLTN